EAINGSGGEGGGATAVANLGLHASSGSVTVGGIVDLEAVAQDRGAGQAVSSALTNISAIAGATGRRVSLGGLVAAASASNAGGGGAVANAFANIDPPGVVDIAGNAEVLAFAFNSGAETGNPGAAANAFLDFSDFGTVIVGGSVIASATAINLAP